MASIIVPKNERRVVRRSVRVECQIVCELGLRTIDHTTLDLSPDGMLVACGDDIGIGEKVLVSFRAPQTPLWFHAEGRVMRVVAGRRPGDRGRALGLRFEKAESSMRSALAELLRGVPPPVPSRKIRPDYLATVMSI
ncbi:MAG: PilZ domain-containing protein [Sandaracinaceae bacterium]|jgi:hypothetical protein|nr:PilZ domain-containing protein [Sandaracinaceae bacterium]